jgi:UDP-N-acetylglucosamine 2-epimerase (non-hydrolysing)
MHITLVAGTRPNFVKICPIIKEIIKRQSLGESIEYTLVHTGQHYDSKMSTSFFEDLQIPLPDFNLNVGSGSQSEQTASIMVNFEKYLKSIVTDLVLVVGDVNSTMACAIATKKLNIKLAHVEAGIRSFDNSMPEEINRKITDSITDFFFTTTEFANQNLINEGIDSSKISLVGNVMIDTLKFFKSSFKKPTFFDQLALFKTNYLVLTLHRPSNVDDLVVLNEILNNISDYRRNLKVVFPVHPRTYLMIQKMDILPEGIQFVDPLGYLEFNYLVENSALVITDSGGITEETTYLKIPCLTLRDNTERPETCLIGTNKLIGSNPNAIKNALDDFFDKPKVKSAIPDFWDGNSSERIISTLQKINLG